MQNPLIDTIREFDGDDDLDIEELEREQDWLQNGHSCRTLNPVTRDWVEDGFNETDE